MVYPSENEAEAEIEQRRRILFGTVVDERGSAVTDARVFASFALHGRTDANGGFALVISPTDGSNSLGSVDFPMYVWAWRENDPHRVAWTLIRHPASAEEQLSQETTPYAITEETHQGVKLVVEDENDLAQYIPGDPGELFEEPEGGPVTEGIVLAMEPAGVIMGQVTDASGRSVANATVRIEEFTLQLGINTLTVNNLDYEWKADVSTVTDAHGYYQLSNLPISWVRVKLRAALEGYGAGQAEYEGAGLSSDRGCDVQLAETEPEEDMPEADSEPLGLSSARGGFAAMSADVTSSESEDHDDEEDQSERSEILSGNLIDEWGNALAGARVFGSLAQHGTTDANGSFGLVISPEDSSNSLGDADFPMYVWAYEENDPYRLAWTVIRHPDSDREIIELESERGGTQVIEETHQGVKLVIEDENDLARYIAGNPGRLEDPNGSPTVHAIVLVTGPAGVITGWVSDANGSAVADAKVSIDQLQMQLGKNTLTISNLNHEWKAEAFAVTDAQGYYQLNNLPASWTNITLKAEADGYATAQQDFQNAGGNRLDGCDVQLVQGEQEESATTAVESGGSAMGMGMYGGYGRAGE
jgi:protocatechuate 3,4-dioxygenase beta subunit